MKIKFFLNENKLKHFITNVRTSVWAMRQNHAHTLTNKNREHKQFIYLWNKNREQTKQTNDSNVKRKQPTHQKLERNRAHRRGTLVCSTFYTIFYVMNSKFLATELRKWWIKKWLFGLSYQRSIKKKNVFFLNYSRNFEECL